MKPKSAKTTTAKAPKQPQAAKHPKKKPQKAAKPVEEAKENETVTSSPTTPEPQSKSSSKIDLRSVWKAKNQKKQKPAIPDVFLVGEEPAVEEKLHKTAANPIAKRKAKKDVKKVPETLPPVRGGTFRELISKKLDEEMDVDEQPETTPQSDWLLAYDQFISILFPKKDVNGKKMTLEAFVAKAATTLETAWAGRVVEFAIFDTGFRRGSTQNLLIGVRLTTRWSISTTQGPVANQPEAQAFRQFYGEQSELRKMLDGSICEAVVWFDENSKGATHRRSEVLVSIAKAVLNKHVSPVKASLRRLDFGNIYTPAVEYNPISEAFERLSTAIRGLKDLPLTVSDVNCTSAFWRRTEPFPPIGRFCHYGSKWSASEVMEDGVARIVDAKTPKTAGKDDDEAEEPVDSKLITNLHTPFFTAALPVMLTLEHSAKFGDTFQIMNKFKVAFYIEIAERLRNESLFFTVPTDNCLYVVIDNIAFKVEIGQGKEIALAKRLETEKKTAQLPPGVDWRTLKHKIEYLPQMSTQIQGLVQRFTAFGPTCQLLKRFFAAHCLLEHFEDVAVELIVAATFLKLDAERGWPPMDHMAGFTQCLSLLATHDFAKEPLFIDFNGELTEEKMAEHTNTFLATRPILPPLVIYTSDDDSGIRFTRSGPELPVFSRAVDLATNALVIIRKHIECVVNMDASKLLTSSMDGYDAIIQLDHSTVVFSQNHFNSAKASAAKFDKKPFKKLLPVVNFNPVSEFHAELKRTLNDFALFFYDRYGGQKIGVMFRPSFVAPIGFKASNQLSCRKRDESDESKFFLNKAEFTETVRIIGKGVVHAVTLKGGEIL
uniref:Nucleolar protein 6 n=1 Tax=Panagrellus redivivus TaxID=6233 RepID=A0A7E4VZY5_PANRE